METTVSAEVREAVRLLHAVATLDSHIPTAPTRSVRSLLQQRQIAFDNLLALPTEVFQDESIRILIFELVERQTALQHALEDSRSRLAARLAQVRKSKTTLTRYTPPTRRLPTYLDHRS